MNDLMRLFFVNRLLVNVECITLIRWLITVGEKATVFPRIFTNALQGQMTAELCFKKRIRVNLQFFVLPAAKHGRLQLLLHERKQRGCPFV